MQYLVSRWLECKLANIHDQCLTMNLLELLQYVASKEKLISKAVMGMATCVFLYTLSYLIYAIWKQLKNKIHKK